MPKAIGNEFYRTILVDFPTARDRQICSRVLDLTRFGEFLKHPSGGYKLLQGHSVISPLYRHSHDYDLGTVLAAIIDRFHGKVYGSVELGAGPNDDLYIKRSGGAVDYVKCEF